MAGAEVADVETTRAVFASQLSQLRPFPTPVDGKIATVPFLEGAKGVVAFVGEHRGWVEMASRVRAASSVSSR